MYFAQSVDDEDLIENDTELKNLDIGDRCFVMEYDRRLAQKALNKKKSKEPPVEEVTSSEIWLKWKVGDHCRALYPRDNLWYEAKIKSIQGDKCTIHYIGFDEDAEMKLNRLDESLGKKERQRQRAIAKEYLANNGNQTKKGNGAKSKSENASHKTKEGNGAKSKSEIASHKTKKGNGAKSKSEIASHKTKKGNGAKSKSENASHKTKKGNGAKSQSEIASPHHSHRRRDHYRPNENQIFNTVAENDFNNPHPVAIYPDMTPVNKTTKGNYYDAKSKSEISSPRHPHRRREHHRPNETQIFDRVPEKDFNNPHPVAIYPRMPPVGIPAALPMLERPNSTLYAMLSSWYMAGYYTGLNQGRKGSFQQHCCCQNCC